MTKIRIFINGFGRIGRAAARIVLEDSRFELVGINDLYDFAQMAYLLKYDSVYGTLEEDVHLKEDTLLVGECQIALFSQHDPAKLDIADLHVDLLLQCSGVFLTTEQNAPLLTHGAKKIVISAPATDETPTFVYGFNHHEYQGESIISASSCSANAIVPIFALIQKHFGIQSAMLSMIHSYTAYQKLLDVKHYSKDIRRARSATQNIIPLESSAASETAKFFPHLEGKLYAKSIRVPVASCTFYDLSLKLQTQSDLSVIQKTLINHDNKDILALTDAAVVSSDFVRSAYSATLDLSSIALIENDLLRIGAWQDNEYGYAKRLVDMAFVVATSSNI